MTIDHRGRETSVGFESGHEKDLGESVRRLPEILLRRFRIWSRTLWAPVYLRIGLALITLGAIAMIGARAQGEPSGTAVLKISARELPRAPAGPAPPLGTSDAPCPPRVQPEIQFAPAPAGSLAQDSTAPSAPQPAPPPSRSPESPRIVLNTASAAELDRLPGVGPKRAEEIVKLRERLGRFRRLSDLLRIRGVGPKTLKKWQDLVVMDPEPQVAPGAEEATPKKE